jgi:hypothetical protein
MNQPAAAAPALVMQWECLFSRDCGCGDCYPDAERRADEIADLKGRARYLARQLGSMREGGPETERAALRRELASVEAALAAARATI